MKAAFVTGHSRSGTSLTAGLLASQGVWFGPCHGPADINQKGFYESTMLKDRITTRKFVDFTAQWDEWMEQNGARSCWGVKTGPEYFKLFEGYNPVVVCTYRAEKDILSSRKRAGFRAGKAAMRKANRWIARLPFHTITVYPDEFARGEFGSLITVLRALDLEFDRDAAESWVDPSLWGEKCGLP